MNVERIDYSQISSKLESEISPDLVPDYIVPVLTVDLFKYLYEAHGTDNAVGDVDNTLAGGADTKTSDAVNEFSVQALREARSSGILKKYGLLSNVQFPVPRYVRRVEDFAQLFDTEFFHAATLPFAKPHPKAAQKILEKMGVSAERTVFIGDQLGKDIRVARRVGAISVLLHPYFGEDPWYRDKGKREKERKIIESILAAL